MSEYLYPIADFASNNGFIDNPIPASGSLPGSNGAFITSTAADYNWYTAVDEPFPANTSDNVNIIVSSPGTSTPNLIFRMQEADTGYKGKRSRYINYDFHYYGSASGNIRFTYRYMSGDIAWGYRALVNVAPGRNSGSALLTTYTNPAFAELPAGSPSALAITLGGTRPYSGTIYGVNVLDSYILDKDVSLLIGAGTSLCSRNIAGVTTQSREKHKIYSGGTFESMFTTYYDLSRLNISGQYSNIDNTVYFGATYDNNNGLPARIQFVKPDLDSGTEYQYGHPYISGEWKNTGPISIVSVDSDEPSVVIDTGE